MCLTLLTAVGYITSQDIVRPTCLLTCLLAAVGERVNLHVTTPRVGLPALSWLGLGLGLAGTQLVRVRVRVRVRAPVVRRWHFGAEASKQVSKQVSKLASRAHSPIRRPRRGSATWTPTGRPPV